MKKVVTYCYWRTKISANFRWHHLMVFLFLTYSILALGQAQAPPSYAPTNDLLAYWQFNYPGVSAFLNYPDNASFSVQAGTVTFAADRDGNAEQSISVVPSGGGTPTSGIVSNDALFHLNGTSLTMHTLVSINASQVGQRSHLIGKRGNAGSAPFNSYTLMVEHASSGVANAPVMTFALSSTSGNDQTISYQMQPSDFDRWMFVTAVYDGSQMRLYIDGDLKASGAASGNINIGDVNALFGIGGLNINNLAFSGKIDETYLYSRALSLQEIQDLTRTNDFLLNRPALAITNQSNDRGICTSVPPNIELFVEINRFPGQGSFQWKKNGVDLAENATFSGVNTARLTINNVGVSELGTYTCEVVHEAESVTSADVVLSNLDPVIPGSFDISTGLVSNFPLNHANFGFDTEGNSTLTQFGVINSAEDRFNQSGKAISFSAGNVIKLMLSPSINYNEATVAFWINNSTKAGDAKAILSGGAISSHHPLFLDGEELYYRTTTTSSSPTGVFLPAGVWKHVAFAIDGNNLTLYVDGEVAFTATDASTLTSLGITTIGNNESDNNPLGHRSYEGLMDELRIYDRKLAAADVKALANTAKFSINNNSNVFACLGKEFTFSATSESPIQSWEWYKDGVEVTSGVSYNASGSTLSLTNISAADFGSYTARAFLGCYYTESKPIVLGELDPNDIAANLIHHYPFYNGSLKDFAGTNDIELMFNLNFTQNREGLEKAAVKRGNTLHASESALVLTDEIDNSTTSVSFWINFKNLATADRRIIQPIGGQTILWLPPSNNTFHILNKNNNNYVNTGVTLTDERWHHVVFAKNGYDVALYVDGELRYSGTDNTTDLSTRPIKRLVFSGANNFLDEYADFRFYNEFLSLDKVRMIYSIPEFSEMVYEPVSACLNNSISISAQGGANTTGYQWFKGGVALTNTNGFQDVNSATLTINNPTVAQHAGEYSVTIFNQCIPAHSVNFEVTVSEPIVADLRQNLIHHYPLDQATGLTNCVLTSSALTATNTGQAGDRFLNANRSANLFGINSGLAMSPLTNNQLTLSFWAYNNANMGTKILVGSNDNNIHHLYLNGDQIVHYPRVGNNNVSTGYVMPANQWVNVTIVRNGSNAKYYMNGVLIADEADAISLTTSPIQVIGNNPGNFWGFGSLIDEIRVYDRALSQQEIELLTNISEIQYDNYEEAVNGCEGSQVTLSYGVANAADSYQWYKDGNPVANSGTISGATTPELVITVNPANEGNYYLEAVLDCNYNYSYETSVNVGSEDLVFATQPQASTACEGEDVTLSATFSGTTTPTGYQWYKNDVPVLNNTKFSGATTASLTISNGSSDENGNYKLEVSGGACGNIFSSDAFVSFNSLPETPVDGTPTANLTICEDNTTTLEVEAASDGSTAYWFATNVSTAELGTGNSFVTPSLSANTTYYVERKWGDCKSVRIPITVTVNATPSAPTADASQTFCAGATVADLEATGTAIKWYDAATAGAEVLTTANLTDATSYFASQTVNGCESSRTQVTAVVNPIPSAPTGNATQEFCASNNPTIADLTVTGNAVKWYDAVTAGNELTAATVLVDGETYYASQTTNNCESTSRLAVEVSFTTPNAPTGDAAQSFCFEGTVADLSATGTAIKWYDAATAGNELTAATALVDGDIYYASQEVDNCESATRLAVTVEIKETLPPTGDANQAFCNAATVADLVATGTAVEWFDVATGGTALTPATNLVDGQIYYAEQTANGCTSQTRLAVTVGIGIPDAPTADATQAFCGTATVADLEATGASIAWYADATGGTALATSTALVDGNSYYASQTAGTCESPTRTEVTVAINAIPSAPTGTATQEFCATSNATVADLSATGAAIKWYNAATAGNEFTPATTLVNGTTYYASQTTNNCESSDRLAVQVNLTSPNAPTGVATQSFCFEGTVADLLATGTAIKWYDAATAGNLLTAASALVDGNVYYASQEVDNCESATRLAVTVELIETLAPTGDANQAFCADATVADLVATGTDVEWFDVATGGTALTAATNLVDGQIYYAEQTANGCTSQTRLAVTVGIGIPDAPTADAAQTFCGTATVADLEATGASIAWYADETGGTALATSTALVDGNTYFATQSAGTCESPTRTAVTVTINAIPSVPTGSTTQDFCGAATIADLTVTGNGVVWFDAAVGGNELLSSAVLVDGESYYAGAVENGCESATRLAVTANVTSTQAPTGNATQVFCNGGTVAAINVTGTNITWYDAASNGNVIDPSTALANGTYYATQTINGCESEVLAVTVSTDAPAAPTGSPVFKFCGDTELVEAEAEIVGSTIVWYDAATGGNVVAPTTLVVNGTTYYAAQVIDGCESEDRLAVTAIDEIPTPTGPVAQEFCESATIGDLAIDDVNIVWYDAAEAGTQLPAQTALVDGETYYAALVNGQCESEVRLGVTATIITVDAGVSQNDNVLTAEEVGATYQWVDCDNGNAPITGATDQTFTATSNGNYAVIVTVNDCEKTSACYEVNTLSTDKFEQFNLSVYPNPSNGKFTIETSQATTITVVDAVGKVLLVTEIQEGVNPIDLKDAMNGVYFIQFNNGETQHVQRVVINH